MRRSVQVAGAIPLTNSAGLQIVVRSGVLAGGHAIRYRLSCSLERRALFSKWNASAREERNVVLSKWRQEWILREQNTADTIRRAYKDCIRNRRLDHDTLAARLDALCRLTWINKGGGTRDLSPVMWDALHKPSLVQLYTGASAAVSRAALQQRRIGFVNRYGPFRVPQYGWVASNSDVVARLFAAAYDLDSDIQGRRLYEEVAKLPKMHGGHGSTQAAYVLTPALACLDPRHRVPIINGNDWVQGLLRKLGVHRASLVEQYDGMVRLIGQNGIQNAFWIDVLGADTPITIRETRRHERRPSNTHSA